MGWKDLKRKRRQLVDRLLPLSLEEQQMEGRHPVLGSMTMIEWIEFFLLHEAHHLMAIFRISRRLKNQA